eukprot:CAMPEP_0198304336 /NCGR_PEP_ID=MMETSP1449-20131203/57350_1 /TAXON_ID=420275 /ORGANISM="Attheya septentrionalis, Strain CCMP2084" /LENGTH=561 /DNA_ID=CAMNT_0044006857 /DNA_START=560 /DNA_END=2245 /DNA_ORIENTATION=-
MPTKTLFDENGAVLPVEQQGIKECKHISMDSAVAKHEQPTHSQDAPLSILSALRGYQKRRLSGAVGFVPECYDLSPMDIVAAVLSISFKASNKSVELIVSDPSIPSDTYAQVFIVGSKETDKVLEMQVSTGDIMRFNRLSIKHMSRRAHLLLEGHESATSTKDQIYSTFNSKIESVECQAIAKESPGMPKIICKFHFSWINPEAGLPFTRLASASFESEDDRTIVPESMQTPHAIISDVLRWVSTWKRNSSHQNLSLSAPCRRRQISEIKKPNLLSDVLVKVISYDMAARQKLRKKSKLHNFSYAIAILSDNGCMIALHDCQKFHTSLEAAVRNGTALLITRLVSQHYSGTGAGEPDTVLLPTDASIVRVSSREHAPDSHPLDHNMSQNVWSQANINHQISSLASDTSSRTVVVLSNILNISFKDSIQTVAAGNVGWTSVENFILDALDKNSDEIAVKSAFNEKSITCDKTEPDYKTAIITLGDQVSGTKYSGQASSLIIRTLCGSISACEVINPSNTQMRLNAMNLFQAIVQGGIELLWTLCRSDQTEVWDISNVILPRL